MAQAQVIAQVSVLSGQAFARDSAGNTRRLKLGDAIREGESVIAADGAKVVLTLADGREMNVRPGETARIDSEVAASIKPDASDSSVANNPQGFQKIVAALKAGSDLDSLLEEDAPAAGQAGQGGNEGHTFVELLRIVETVDPLSFQFGTNRGRPLETIEGAPGLRNAAPDAINDTNSLQINGTATGSVLANDTDPNKNPLTVTGFSVDTNGDGVPETFTPGQTATIAGVGSLVIGANGAYTFAPLLDYDGLIPVASYIISDGQGGSDTATLALSMIPNSPPDAVNDGPVTVLEDTPVNGNVLANDTDPNGNPLTVSGFSIDTDGDGVPEQFTPGQTATIIGVGALTIGVNGAYSFTPQPNYAGSVPAATYDITDGQGGIDSAMLVLGPVTPVNDAPVPLITPAAGDEDTPIVVNLSGTDPDGTIQSVTVTALPPASEGVLYLPDGITPVTAGTPLPPADAAHLIFAPAPNYNGPVNIPFTVTDNQGLESAPAVAPITVNPVNDAPVPVITPAAGNEDTPIVVNLSGNDPDGTIQSVTVTALPPASEGVLYLPDGITPVTAGTPLTPADAAHLIFAPAPNYNGPVNIPFTVTDNQGLESAPAVAPITVNPVNDAPAPVITPAAGDEDTPITVNLTGTDPDGSIQSVTVTALPPASEGVLYLPDGVTPVTAGTPLTPADAAHLVFTPAPNYNGPVNIPFTVTDNQGLESAPAVAPITVNPVVDPVISIDDVTVNEAAGTMTFTVTLDQPTTATVTVAYNTTDGSANASGDYTGTTGSLTFAPGVVTQVVTVNLNNDAIYEGSETFNVNLTTPVNASILDGIGLGTIKDDGTGAGGTDNDRPRISAIGSPSIVEGGNLDFNVTLSNTSTTPTTVTLTPASGTATLGTDTSPLQVSFDGGATWSAVVGTTVSVPAGNSGFIVRVPTVNDALGEPMETMTLSASTPQGGVVGTGTITDNDTPVVSISGPVTYNEAAGTATFTVTLSNVSTVPVSVAYATANGTATAGSDYTAGSGTLNFAPGVTSQTITVAIANDTVYEGAETFNVNLSAPSNATLGTATSTATIIDDGTGVGGTNSDAPTLAVNSISVNENAGYAVFTVSLSNPSAIATTVNLGLANGTALASADFTNSLEVSTNGGLTWVAANSATFAPGATSLLARVPVINDTLDEVNETFSLLATRVSGVTTNIGTSGTATIIDNDSTPVPTLDTKTVLEDNAASGNVLLNDTDADGNVLSVTQFVINGTTYLAGTTAILAGIGSFRINSDGSYLFTPDLNYNGSVPVATYTVSDGTNTATSTLTISVTPVNDVPVVSLASGAVSEEGLAGGIADSLGTSDTTNSATVSGTLVATDVEADAVTAWNISVPVGALTSGGQAVSWASSTVAGLTTLTGTAGGVTVATLTLNSSGQYTFTLSKPIDHAGANVEDVKILDFAVTATAGGQTSAPSTLSISVEDDAPAVIPAQVANLAMIDTNLEIVLDISGSMTTTDGVNGQTRLLSAVDSIKTLLDRYDEFGDVHVKLVTFSSGADSRGTGWVTVAQAKALLDAQVAGGGTNYDEALGDAITAYGETGKLANAQNVAYFFTDGLPTFGAGSNTALTGTRNGTGFDQTGSDTGIQASEETTWINFLRANQVKAFAVAFGAGVTDTGYLDPIAYDGQTMTNTGGTLVSSFDQLDSMLAGTVQNPVGGQLVSGGLLNAGGLVGADGGFIKSVTIEGTIYTYNPAGTGSISVAGTNRGVFDTATNSLTVTTTNSGVFVVDLDNGAYTYAAPPSISSSIVETMNYVVTDKDGDTQPSSITVNVDRTNVVIGTTGAETLNGGNGPDLILARDGNDTITGGNGNDQLLAGDGNDTASGGAGNDRIDGGAGTDLITGGIGSDALTGGLGADTFRWMLGDAAGAPTDTIKDFNVALPASGGDILNLQDLLVGESHVGTDPGNLANYLHFSFSSTTGNTTIDVTTHDGASTTQTVVLEGVNLVGAFTTDQQIIQTLLTNGKLITD